MNYRQYWFSIRSYVPIPFFLLGIYLASPTLTSILTGIILILIGESIRLWGVSVAGSETRTTGPVGGTHLFTDGPFGHVRNPLYLGNILIYIGSMYAANWWMPWLPIFTGIFFLIQYRIFISIEEKYLQKTFSSEFDEYCKHVSRLIPRIIKYKGTHSFHREPDLKRGIESEKRTLQIIIIFLLIMFIKLK